MLQVLHQEYFKELLQYYNEFQKFKQDFKMDDNIKSKKKEKIFKEEDEEAGG